VRADDSLLLRTIFLTGLFVASSVTWSEPPHHYAYRIHAQYPQDPTLFTQGLEFDGDTLLQSGGHYGKSRILQRSLTSTTPLNQRRLSRRYFGEGLTVLGDKVYQLTWRSGTGFIYDRNTLEPLQRFAYRGEGWGLCNNGSELIMSDGSATLRFLDPTTLKVKRTLPVTLNGKALRNLNELEWVNGLIYANVWQQSFIVMIDPNTGHVVGRLDLDNLLTARQQADADVLNGIAYHAQTGLLFVTGKLWPSLFALELNNTDVKK
jgi:glutamine cyclotransferase